MEALLLVVFAAVIVYLVGLDEGRQGNPHRKLDDVFDDAEEDIWEPGYQMATLRPALAPDGVGVALTLSNPVTRPRRDGAEIHLEARVTVRVRVRGPRLRLTARGIAVAGLIVASIDAVASMLD